MQDAAAFKEEEERRMTTAKDREMAAQQVGAGRTVGAGCAVGQPEDSVTCPVTLAASAIQENVQGRRDWSCDSVLGQGAAVTSPSPPVRHALPPFVPHHHLITIRRCGDVTNLHHETSLTIRGSHGGRHDL